MSKTSKKHMVNKVYGMLTVLREISERNKNGHILYECLCSCGNKLVTLGSSLRSGGTKSCGCLQRDRVSKHGLYKKREFSIWNSMVFRCSETSKSKNYYLRGIRVCDSWKNSFFKFYSDMGDCPKGFSLDRINNNEGYSPENCRWASAKTQATNRRSTVNIELDGEVKSFSEWCRVFNKPMSTVRNRISRGWSVERAFKEPVVRKNIQIKG